MTMADAGTGQKMPTTAAVMVSPRAKERLHMGLNEIETKVRKLRQLQKLIEEAQAEAEAIKDDLKSVMGHSECLIIREYTITWKMITSSRIDTTALKKALPDIAEQFMKTTTNRRFIVA